MIDPEDPPRLIDPTSSASPRLRELLSESRADVATEAQLQALSAALAPTLGTGAVGGATAAKASLPGLVKVAIAVGVTTAAGGAYLATREAPPSPPQTRIAAPVEREAPKPPVAPAAPPALPAESASPEPAPAVNTPVVSAPKHAAAAPSEAELLGAAQAALGSDPAKALSLAEQHARAYPGGTLGQEREVIAVEALAKLGRTAASRERGERFLAAHPKSAYRAKIQSILGER
ncbi:MAG TPA: hypothetical protein VHE30_00380 [Polyangiaceae bacterium]|nr:hypothetical protein [Polyangiaceae bacterium]